MLDRNDFVKKQVLLVMCSSGEKFSFKNDNIVIKDADGNIKFQLTCYRIFALFAVGNITITSGLIQRAHRFNFSIALFTPAFKLYDIIAVPERGNTVLRRRQYSYEGLDIARHIITNKIQNQQELLKGVHNKSDYLKEAVEKMNGYISYLAQASSLQEIMAYEGLSSKVYFKSWFNNVLWKGRKPRVKCDITNTLLDIGYTVLFNFIEALLYIYGFDVYVGVLHREFYMRKSLVCDMVEPFRPIIDHQVKVSINLKQFTEDDFLLQNHQYILNWKSSPKVVGVFLKSIMERKAEMFTYIQRYYRCFMKNDDVNKFPSFKL